MEEITINEFQENLEEIIERVENGEKFLIMSNSGSDIVILPYSEYSEYINEYFETDEAS